MGCVLFKAISPWQLQSFAVTRHFMATHHLTLTTPIIHACDVDKNNLNQQKI